MTLALPLTALLLRQRTRIILLAASCLVLWTTLAADAFVIQTPPLVLRTTPATWQTASTATRARISSTQQRIRTRTTSLHAVVDATRRKELLTRRGPHFYVDRSTGRIEFGATAYLKTQLDNDGDHREEEGGESKNLDRICSWLQDEKSLAMSIWDEELIQERGGSVYRLQVMSLQFVTLQVAPWVDMEMKTLMDKKSSSSSNQQPVFCLRSVGFDPNIQVLPGMRVSAESFGIVIEVAGQLRPSADGRGVQGAIAFQTTGRLSRPMRLIPEPALKAACDAIVETVVKFATESFQKGAKSQYQKMLRQKQLL